MNIEKVKAIDTYISKQYKGSARDLASKVGVSTGMLYKYLKYMKEELKAPIEYNKRIKKFYYTQSGTLCIKGWLDNTN